MKIILTCLGLLALVYPGDPPYWATNFMGGHIITSEDTSALKSAPYHGQESRKMFDRRVGDWVSTNAYLFQVSFSDGLTTEFQVHSEFGNRDAAAEQVMYYGRLVGQLPNVLRSHLETFSIMKGKELFGGGNKNVHVSIEQGDEYMANGNMEETLAHEAAHASLDPFHKDAPGWLEAQRADSAFISIYARDETAREDVAESFVAWIAVRYFSHRLTVSMIDTIESTIPNRLAYFDKQDFNMYPYGLYISSINNFISLDKLPVTALEPGIPAAIFYRGRVGFFLGNRPEGPLTVTNLRGQVFHLSDLSHR